MIFLKDSIYIRKQRLRQEAASDGAELQEEEVNSLAQLPKHVKLKQLFSLKNVKDGVKWVSYKIAK